MGTGERIVAPPAPGRRRVRAVVAYDGASFHGFASNEGVTTVAGVLTGALQRILQVDVELTGAGRTDAGVHARGQVVSFDVPASIDLLRLHRSLNALCAPAIVVTELDPAADDFDARFSALWRRYRYHVLNARWPDPLRAATAWHVSAPLDPLSMSLACDPFVGEHDFSSFCRRPKVTGGLVHAGPSMVRRVLSARWCRGPDDDLFVFEITANAFCHQMVRSIVGFLVDVGHGRRHAGEVLATIRARDRSAAGTVAPPHGLVLWEVGYPS